MEAKNRTLAIIAMINNALGTLFFALPPFFSDKTNPIPVAKVKNIKPKRLTVEKPEIKPEIMRTANETMPKIGKIGLLFFLFDELFFFP